jgi:hypothetical protein
MNDPLRDPFDERPAREPTRVMRVAGVTVAFSSASRALLDLAETAFGNVPARTVALPFCRVRLVLTADASRLRGREPPLPRASACDGVINACVDAANYVIVNPARRAALVAISPSMLRFHYHARYELLEFAVLELLARSQEMLSLHAACLGAKRRCVLLLGDSGAGKSTACTFGLLEGLEFVAEDSVMVDPRKMTAIGVPAYLHVDAGTLELVKATKLGAQIRKSRKIRRRSGAQKFEFDARGRGLRLATVPLRIVAVVALSSQPAGARPALRALTRGALLRLMKSSQPYASGRPEWARFCEKVTRLPGYELRRGRTARDAVKALRPLLKASAK